MFSVWVQFEIYLLQVCLIIPFNKISGECSLETERKKQKNMERKLHFSLQSFLRLFHVIELPHHLQDQKSNLGLKFNFRNSHPFSETPREDDLYQELLG